MIMCRCVDGHEISVHLVNYKGAQMPAQMVRAYTLLRNEQTVFQSGRSTTASLTFWCFSLSVVYAVSLGCDILAEV